MQVTMRVNRHGGALGLLAAGQTYDVDDALAFELVGAGYAVHVARPAVPDFRPDRQVVGGGATAQRRRVADYYNKGALIAAPAWASAAVVAQRKIVRHSSGQLLFCVTAGTTGGTEPAVVMNGPINDGTAVWVATGRTSRLASGQQVPTVSIVTSSSGLTEYRFLENQSRFLQLTSQNIQAHSSGNSSWAWQFNDGGAANSQGNGVGLMNYRRVSEFISDSPVVLTGAWNVAGNAVRVLVDGFQVEEDPTPLTAGNPCWYRLDWAGVRRLRHYRVEMSTGINLRGIAVDPAAQVYAAPRRETYGLWLSDSYGSTVSTYSTVGWEFLSERLGDELGIAHLVNWHRGGTGYLANGTPAAGSPWYTARQMIQNNTLGNPELLTHVFFAHGYNDNARPASEVQQEAIATWRLARERFPNAAITVIGPWADDDGGGAAPLQAIDAALMQGFAAWADPLSIYVTSRNDAVGSWITGLGRWGNTTGVGNADFYMGADGVHPSLPGVNYWVGRLQLAIDAGLAALGK